MRDKPQLWIGVLSAGVLAGLWFAFREPRPASSSGPPVSVSAVVARGADEPMAEPAGPSPTGREAVEAAQATDPPAGTDLGAIRGRVVPPPDAALGPEVLGRSEVVLDSDARHGALAPDLRFELTGLVPGAHRLRLRVPGFGPLEREARVRAGEITQLELALAPGVRIAGRVQDESGQPVAGACVHARSTAEGELGPLQLDALSDERGEFRIVDLPAGSLSVDVTARDFVATRGDLGRRPAGDSHEGLVFVLRRGQSLGGRVWLPNGNAAAGARISIEDERSLYWRGGFADTWDARCNGEGLFRVHGLSAGPFRVRAWIPSTDPLSERATASLSGVAAGTPDLGLRLCEPGSIELILRSRGELVHGCSVVVLDRDGAATGGTPDAIFAEERRPSWSVREDGEGCRIEGVEAGERLALVRCPDRRLAGWAGLVVQPGTVTRAVIELAPAALLVPRPSVAEGVTLTVRDEGEFVLCVDGDLEQAGVLLPAGRYRVRAASAQGAAELDVILVGGERRELRLALE